MRLKELRAKAHYTQAQIAEKLNLTTVTYSRYETGNREIPIDIIINLSALYNVSIEYLLGLCDEEGNSMVLAPETKSPLEIELSQTFKALTNDNQFILLGEAKKLLKEQK